MWERRVGAWEGGEGGNNKHTGYAVARLFTVKTLSDRTKGGKKKKKSWGGLKILNFWGQMGETFVSLTVFPPPVYLIASHACPLTLLVTWTINSPSMLWAHAQAAGCSAEGELERLWELTALASGCFSFFFLQEEDQQKNHTLTHTHTRRANHLAGLPGVYTADQTGCKSCRGSTTLASAARAAGKENNEDAASVKIDAEVDASRSITATQHGGPSIRRPKGRETERRQSKAWHWTRLPSGDVRYLKGRAVDN